MITRAEKQKQVESLSQNIKKSAGGFLVNFKGLNVEQMTKMRKKLSNNKQSNITVCRNTLFKKALEPYSEQQKHLSPHLMGSNAFVFAFSDPSQVAKELFKFAKQNQALKIKTGILDGKGISLEEIKTLADLPSKQELRAKFLAVLAGPMSQFMALALALPKGLLRVLDSHKENKNKS